MSGRFYLLGLLLCGAVAVLGQSSSASLNPSSSSAARSASSGSGSQQTLVSSRSGSSAPVTAASSSSGPLSSVLTTTSSQQASGSSDSSSSSTTISSSSSAGLAPCPVGKTCCANLVEQRTEICPFAVGVCCNQGGDQLAGYCCPPGSKCISEHFNDGKQSGLNQFRVSCMRNNGKVQLFKLPPASKTLTFEEEQKLLENLAKNQDAASDGEVHGAPNPYRGSSGGSGLTPEQQAEKKRQDDEKKRAAKLAKMQKKGLKLKKINFNKPTVITVLDNENSVAKDEEPKSDLPPAPKFTQEELDNILSGAGQYVAPVPTLPPARTESSTVSSSSSASEASAASTKASSASVSAKSSSEGSEGSEAAAEASESGSK